MKKAIYFQVLSLIKQFIFSIFLIISLFVPSHGFAETVYGGILPPWITGPQNNIVANGRQVAQAGLGAYVPWIANAVARSQTTCVYFCSIALRGVKGYGADKEFMLDYSEKHPGDLLGVGEIINVAKELGDWHEGTSYTPKAGDVVIVENGRLSGPNDYWGDHAIMVTESGGFIYGGGTSTYGTGVNGLGRITETNVNALDHGSYNPNQPIIYGIIETSKYSNGVGILSNVVNWGLDALATIGDGINELVEQFTVLADNVLQAMVGIGLTLVGCLIMIDFATWVMSNGFEFQLSAFVSRIIRYAFLIFVFLNWGWIVNNIFLDFAESTSAVVMGAETSEHLTQPDFLLAKGVEAVAPALNFISTAKGLTDIKNWPLLAFLVIITFTVLAFLIISTIYVAYIFIEFYLIAAFNAFFILFPTCRFTKLIAEGGLGSLLKSAIKLFVAACLIFILATWTKNANLLIEWPANTDGLSSNTLTSYIKLCIYICVFVWMILRIPGRIADIYGGKVDLPG